MLFLRLFATIPVIMNREQKLRSDREAIISRMKERDKLFGNPNQVYRERLRVAQNRDRMRLTTIRVSLGEQPAQGRLSE